MEKRERGRGRRREEWEDRRWKKLEERGGEEVNWGWWTPMMVAGAGAGACACASLCLGKLWIGVVWRVEIWPY